MLLWFGAVKALWCSALPCPALPPRSSRQPSIHPSRPGFFFPSFLQRGQPLEAPSLRGRAEGLWQKRTPCRPEPRAHRAREVCRDLHLRLAAPFASDTEARSMMAWNGTKCMSYIQPTCPRLGSTSSVLAARQKSLLPAERAGRQAGIYVVCTHRCQLPGGPGGAVKNEAKT
jgi:hypothetical protein